MTAAANPDGYALAFTAVRSISFPRLFSGCVGLILLAGCSSAQITTDHEASFDFRQLRAWDWAPLGPELKTPAAERTADRIRLDSLVRSRVDTVLSQRGYLRDRQRADFLVSWSFGEWQIEQKGSSASRYGAVGLYYPGMHASGGRTSTDGRALPPSVDPYSRNSEEAQLDLVMVDAKSNRVIWHGHVTDKSDFGYFTGAQTSEVSQALNTMLRDFPPEQ